MLWNRKIALTGTVAICRNTISEAPSSFEVPMLGAFEYIEVQRVEWSCHIPSHNERTVAGALA